jgi:hypothetical protein
MKQLERLLFLQGNRCFFCEQPIPSGEASVEHLNATANGGAKDDENCVACCRAVNAALGSLSVKAKLRAILNHRGTFACPQLNQGSTTTDSAPASAAVLEERLNLVVADLQKRGASKPRREATLLNTMNSVFQMQLPSEALAELLSALQGKGYVKVEETKVTYALPPQDA